MTSQLFINMPQGIVVMSLSTGSIIKVITEHFELLNGILKNPTLSGISVIPNEFMFLTYNGANGIWKGTIMDDNEEEE
jgi:hypothetical protein